MTYLLHFYKNLAHGQTGAANPGADVYNPGL